MEALGLDIGGTGIKGAPVETATGRLLGERFRVPTPDPATPEAVVEAAAGLVEHFQWKGPIGCGFPALVKGGVVNSATNIHKSWLGCRAAEMIAAATGCPVTLLNDADAAGLAEVEFGAGRGHTGVIFTITIGTGVGTALFTNGHLVPNTELGHILVRFGKEAVVGEQISSNAARKRLDLKWKEWAANVELHLKELERLFAPDLFIIGGGASKKFDRFAEFLDLQTEIVPAQLLNHAGIIGAALATQEFATEAAVS